MGVAGSVVTSTIVTPARSSTAPSCTSRRAPESSIWNAASPAVRLGLIGVSAAPIRHAANMTTTSSTRLVSIVAITSPGPIPAARSIAAVASTRARNSALVSARRSSSMHAAVGSSAARSSGRVASVVVRIMRRKLRTERRSWLRAAATSLRGSLVRADRGTWRSARTPLRRAPSGAGARRWARSRARRSGCAGRGCGR